MIVYAFSQNFTLVKSDGFEQDVFRSLIRDLSPVGTSDDKVETLLNQLGWGFGRDIAYDIQSVNLQRKEPRPFETALKAIKIVSPAITAGSYIDVLLETKKWKRLYFDGKSCSIENVCPILRFAPTINLKADVHIGHLWICYLNQRLAAEIGGKFILDFEMPFWGVGAEAIEYSDYLTRCKSVIEQFKTANVEFDDILYDDDIEYYNTEIEKYSDLKLTTKYKRVFRRILRDNNLNITILVRGNDLLINETLSHFFYNYMQFKSPRTVYVPVLIDKQRNYKISKTDKFPHDYYYVTSLTNKNVSVETINSQLYKKCVIDNDVDLIKDYDININNLNPFPIFGDNWLEE